MATKTNEIVSRVLTEEILTIPQARAAVARTFKKRPHKTTVIRWILKGKLEGVKLGRNWFTSTQALNRMIVATSEVK